MRFAEEHLSPPPVREATRDAMYHEVLAGLRRPQKMLSPKYFYDAYGSQLFDRITELDEYYPTRTETAILRQHIDPIAARLGPHLTLVEYGSGSSVKTRILLDHLDALAAYVPIDISEAHLLQTAARLRQGYPRLPIHPVVADYTTPVNLDFIDRQTSPVVVFFPGSTIGNFAPQEAAAFLAHVAEVAGPGGGLLIGVDLQKDVAVLEGAYNDAQGVTAAFNRNILVHLNQALGATFQPQCFDHHAFYNAAEGRIEMHLVSRREQCVRLGSAAIHFSAGETICTEYSYKFTLDGFAHLAARAGFKVVEVWTDPQVWFSVQYLVQSPG
jgi:dimethylhistidine N-methyltransferase